MLKDGVWHLFKVFLARNSDWLAETFVSGDVKLVKTCNFCARRLLYNKNCYKIK